MAGLLLGSPSDEPQPLGSGQRRVETGVQLEVDAVYRPAVTPAPPSRVARCHCRGRSREQRAAVQGD